MLLRRPAHAESGKRVSLALRRAGGFQRKAVARIATIRDEQNPPTVAGATCRYCPGDRVTEARAVAVRLGQCSKRFHVCCSRPLVESEESEVILAAKLRHQRGIAQSGVPSGIEPHLSPGACVSSTHAPRCVKE